MNINGGDVIAGVLREQGVKQVFTLCGGHISPILAGCNKNGIEIIDVRNEAAAVFAADAVSRLTGTTGVAIVTAGPGVTNCITAIKNAQMAQSPLVLLGGAAATIIKGRGSLQDIDQVSLLTPIVKHASAITSSCDIVKVIEAAFAEARSGVPGPAFVECPIDLLYDEELVRLWYGKGTGSPDRRTLADRVLSFYLKRHVDSMYACDLRDARPEKIVIPPETINEKSIRRAARRLSQATRPLILAGSQVMLDPEQAERMRPAIEKLGAPVYLAGMARGMLGRNHPLQFIHHRKDALREADMLILAGVPCDFRLDYGRSISTESFVLSVNRSRRDLYLNRRPDMAFLSDPGLFLTRLAESLPRDLSREEGWLEGLSKRETERDMEIISRSLRKTEYINPLLLLKKLDEFLDDSAVIIGDGGDFVASASYIIRPRTPLSWLDPGPFGTLGAGGGFALGAKKSRPGSEVWILYGDGAAGYSLQEIDTMVRRGLPVIALIGNDACWSQIERDQVDILKDDIATTLRYSDYHLAARGYGGEGFLLEREEDIESVFSQARQAAMRGKPVVINALIGKTDFRKGSISL